MCNVYCYGAAALASRAGEDWTGMLYPTREDLPDHVLPALVVDYDTFTVDAPDGDFAAAMVRLRDSGVPEIFLSIRGS